MIFQVQSSAFALLYMMSFQYIFAPEKFRYILPTRLSALVDLVVSGDTPEHSSIISGVCTGNAGVRTTVGGSTTNAFTESSMRWRFLRRLSSTVFSCLSGS